MNVGVRDFLCLSHLRWGFVYQRPQHLLSRFAREHRIFFVEEPIWGDGGPGMTIRTCTESGVQVCVPILPHGSSAADVPGLLRDLLTGLIADAGIHDYLLWYYTPMALDITRHLKPAAIVFDIMDELSAFHGAPREMKQRETELLEDADVVFTGGQSLYEAKRGLHSNIHCFPSSLDVDHFRQARSVVAEPADQAGIGRPRVGYCGVIDERMDLALLDAVARMRPRYQFVMLGPVVKIDPDTLPRLHNIHYLGGKNYKDLPAYMSGWNAAMLPFAHNESTRFVSPTKTPEYLAAGLQVVSTSIADVLRPYGVQRLVRIADQPEEFTAALDASLESGACPEWLARVDTALASNSWDRTWQQMAALISVAVRGREQSFSRITQGSAAETAARGD